MSVTVLDVMRIMEEFAPSEIAAQWDNCGLLVGDERQEIKRILIALEPSQTVIEEAIEKKVQLLITHHPMMLNKINRITTSTKEGEKLISLVQNKISLFAAHTNLDQVPQGLNGQITKLLELENSRILTKTNMMEGDHEIGFGRIGYLKKEESLLDFLQMVKEKLKLDHLQYVGDLDVRIRKVAVVTGSGMGELDQAILEGADVLLTGDIKYHSARYAKEAGIALVDGTHFSTENIVRGLLYELLSSKLTDVEILLDEIDDNPLKIF